MTDSKPLRITLPPLQITLEDEQQVSLQWLAQQLNLPSEPQPQVSDSWKTWVMINKLLNQPDEALVKQMVEQGVDVKLALEEVAQASNHPYYQAGDQFVQQLRKLESILQIQQQLSMLSSQAETVERRVSLSRSEFLDGFYSQNKPVVLTGIMNNWKALNLWNPKYLKQHYGTATVEVQGNRNSDPEYELNVEKHRQKVLLKDYIDWIVEKGESNDCYMVANNQNLDREDLKGLMNDLEVFPEYLNPKDTSRRVFFWFGSAGTITPLHHDPVNLMLAQVLGRKRILLIPPRQTPFLYNHLGVFSQVDPENPDFKKYPLYQNIKPIELILKPGEVIFIPVGWWHHVRALDVSISVSFTNFVFPNYYHWQNPTFGRT
ncbi:cupin-like domain-containing protein [Lyngbya sp. PCC 8106]|uniref:cupin-like domain-containing protein n=1 Tax=Lyngbya sp. (strain PCC 8106) TaxID=313612 RepID=UPI0000EAA0F3|nr:cupin-like domain-containing protein [Lyngbya sp. PCC 8106]EAW38021.1 jmjC domain protein [Lyngbya sp. PCC 8106]